MKIKKIFLLSLIFFMYNFSILNAINYTFNDINSILKEKVWSNIKKDKNFIYHNKQIDLIEKKYSKYCKDNLDKIKCYISLSAKEAKIYKYEKYNVDKGIITKDNNLLRSSYINMDYSVDKNLNCINSKINSTIEDFFGKDILIKIKGNYIYFYGNKNKKWILLDEFLLKNSLADISKGQNHNKVRYFSKINNTSNLKNINKNELNFCKKYGDGGFWEDIDSWIVLNNGLNVDVYNKIDKSSFKEISDNYHNFNKIGKLLDLSPRIIAAPCFAEKIRQTKSYRASIRNQIEESFIKDIVSNMGLHNFSEGLCSIKPQIALDIEKHLKSPNSKFYLGDKYKNLLDYPKGINSTNELVKNRLLNDYWNILYAGINIKMHEQLRENKGFSIKGNAGVLSTLYNLGFYKSNPHGNPKNGGAYTKVKIERKNGKIEIKKISFGDIAEIFYNSNYMPEIIY